MNYDNPITNKLQIATEELKEDPYTARPNLRQGSGL